MMEGEKSRTNSNTDLVVDRISFLPNSILGHILSFLPTKEAVATSVLSKRWKFAWVAVHNLDFYYYDPELEQDSAENMKFVGFVHRVLLLNAGPLNKFSLNCHSSICSHVICWIDAAIKINVRELYLYIGGGGEHILKLPISGFNCDSLQSLEVHNFTLVHDATVVCLPRLESLKLDHVHFTSKEACEKLVSGCPMLHYLKLAIYFRDDADDDDCMCIISSASLKRLEIIFRDVGRLKLKASSLEYLKLRGCISEIFVERSLSSLVQADFGVRLVKHDPLRLDEHDFLNNSIVEAVRAFEHAKFVTLSVDVMRALGRATISLSTEFKRLIKLVAGTYCRCVQDFIHNSESLEVLIIYQDYCTSNPHDHSRWTAPMQVPRCLSNSLKKVRFDGYKGLEDEREMIRCMLEHGSALEVMQISCNSTGDGEKLELLQEICEFPRKSPACKVQFRVWPTKREFKSLK